MESEEGPENRSPAGRSVGRLSVLAALVACLALAPRIYGRRGRGGGWGPREGGGRGRDLHTPPALHPSPLPKHPAQIPRRLVAMVAQTGGQATRKPARSQERAP